MTANGKNDSNINDTNSLGKGEVDSSILSGSTTYARDYRVFLNTLPAHPAEPSRTLRELHTSTRGKSVDFDRRLFTAKEEL